MYRIALALALVTAVTCNARAADNPSDTPGGSVEDLRAARAAQDVRHTLAVGAEHGCISVFKEPPLCEDGPFVEYTLREGDYGAFAGIGKFAHQGIDSSASVYTGFEFVPFRDRLLRPLARAGVLFATERILTYGAGFEVGPPDFGGLRFVFSRGQFNWVPYVKADVLTARVSMYLSF